MILAAISCLVIGWLCGYLHYEQRYKTKLIESYKIDVNINSNQDPNRIAKAVLNHLKVVK